MDFCKVKASKSSPSLFVVACEKSTVSRKNSVVSKEAFNSVRDKDRTLKQQRHIKQAKKDSIVNRYPYLIIEEGVNYTPRPLEDLSYPSDDQFLSVQAVTRGSKTTDISLASSSTTLYSAQSRFSMVRLFSPERQSLCVSFASLLDDQHEYISVASIFRLRKDPTTKGEERAFTFLVNLSETETLFQLTLLSSADNVESENGTEIIRRNTEYERVLSSNKAIYHVTTQTPQVYKKHLSLVMPRGRRNNAMTFASIWDIYDSYKLSLQTSLEEEEKNRRGDDVQNTKLFTYQEHTFDYSFFDALMIMERIIVKNTFGERQCDFQGLLVADPLSLESKCSYSLKHLWTFKGEDNVNHVTSMCWSSVKHNILAVGYGKFKYSDICDGTVCVWNVKNPRQPERRYRFKDPVTCVSFSEKWHLILAVSFYSGLVLLLDVSSRSLLVVVSNSHYPLCRPVWQVAWYSHDPTMAEDGQCLITCDQSGRLFKYRTAKLFKSRKIMTVYRPQGDVHSVYRPRKCFSRKVISKLNPSVEVLVFHPDDPLLYLVGTSEGSIYICSTGHRHDCIDVFVAHNGPVYSIRFNPFCSKVLLTCGADFCVRVWADGIFEPLMTLESGLLPVQGALWDPLHSTVIITITGILIEVWDIRRGISKPKSSTVSPSKSFNTVIQFSTNNHNLCIGDADGDVHVMTLTEMPFSPMFQDEVLACALQTVLISRPDILRRLAELGPPFANNKTS